MFKRAIDLSQREPTDEELLEIAGEIAREYRVADFLTPEDVLGEFRDEVMSRWEMKVTQEIEETKRLKDEALKKLREALAAKNKPVEPFKPSATKLTLVRDTAQVIEPELPPKVVAVKDRLGSFLPQSVYGDWNLACAMRGIACNWIRQWQAESKRTDLDDDTLAKLVQGKEILQALIDACNQVMVAWGKVPGKDMVNWSYTDIVVGILRSDSRFNCYETLPKVMSPEERVALKMQEEEKEAARMLREQLIEQITEKLVATNAVTIQQAQVMATRVVRKFAVECKNDISVMLRAAALAKVEETNNAEDSTALVYAKVAGIDEAEWLVLVESVVKDVSVEASERQQAHAARMAAEAARRANPHFGEARKDAPTSKKGQDPKKKVGKKGKGRK